LEFIVLWFLFGIVAALIGKNKGQGCLGFIVGFLLGPIGLIIMIFTRGNRRRCPHCKELINKDASVCPHCRREV